MVRNFDKDGKELEIAGYVLRDPAVYMIISQRKEEKEDDLRGTEKGE